eukprot:scaffold86507_cov24-Tisochrysis_lutea.AAC.2
MKRACSLRRGKRPSSYNRGHGGAEASSKRWLDAPPATPESTARGLRAGRRRTSAKRRKSSLTLERGTSGEYGVEEKLPQNTKVKVSAKGLAEAPSPINCLPAISYPRRTTCRPTRGGPLRWPAGAASAGVSVARRTSSLTSVSAWSRCTSENTSNIPPSTGPSCGRVEWQSSRAGSPLPLPDERRAQAEGAQVRGERTWSALWSWCAPLSKGGWPRASTSKTPAAARRACAIAPSRCADGRALRRRGAPRTRGAGARTGVVHRAFHQDDRRRREEAPRGVRTCGTSGAGRWKPTDARRRAMATGDRCAPSPLALGRGGGALAFSFVAIHRRLAHRRLDSGSRGGGTSGSAGHDYQRGVGKAIGIGLSRHWPRCGERARAPSHVRDRAGWSRPRQTKGSRPCPSP